MGLVPMLDMANLAGGRAANIRWEYSPDDDAVNPPPLPRQHTPPSGLARPGLAFDSPMLSPSYYPPFARSCFSIFCSKLPRRRAPPRGTPRPLMAA